MEYVKRPIRAATAPAAQRVYLNTFFFVTTSLTLLFVAAVAYPIFYYVYVPKKVVSVPIHLQYNAGLNPFGVTSLANDLMLETAYDVTVSLTGPRSPANLNRGNFMVALFATKSGIENPAQSWTIPSDPYEHISVDNVVFSSRRPALVPFKDPLVSHASRLLFLPYHIFAPASDLVTLRIPMGELVEFRGQMPLSLLLDVQAGQTLEVYEAKIELVARLRGIRWVMYNHRIVSYVVCTTAFWLMEMSSLATAWLALSYCIGGRRKPKDPGAMALGYGTTDQDGDESQVQSAVVKREHDGTVARSTKTKEAAVKKEEEDDEDNKGEGFGERDSRIKEESVDRDKPFNDEDGEGTGSSYGKGKAAVRRRASQQEM